MMSDEGKEDRAWSSWRRLQHNAGALWQRNVCMQDDSMQGCLLEFLILYDTKRYFLLHNFVGTDTEQRGR